MPELPEVETVRRGLAHAVSGQRITAVKILNPKTLKDQSEAEFRDRTIGKYIQTVSRRGKYLLLPLTFSDVSFLLCIHLKMRGQIFLSSKTDAEQPYLCLSLTLENQQEIRYHDMWAWGEVRALTEEPATLASMGPEPLSEAWNGAALSGALKGKKSGIKSLLLGQKIVAGVGNIYADESLFAAGIHPASEGQSLTEAECVRLAGAIQRTLTDAVEAGGALASEESSGDVFRDIYGQAGRYQPLVYGQAGKPCSRCGTVLSKTRLAGRGTVFCPSCQSNL